MFEPNAPNSDTVVSLDKFRAPRGGNALRIVEGYWSALREDGSLPSRAQVNPRGLEDALSHVFILERIAPGLARFRIAGSHVTALTGMDARGMPISSFFHTNARQQIGSALDACFGAPAVIQGNRF